MVYTINPKAQILTVTLVARAGIGTPNPNRQDCQGTFPRWIFRPPWLPLWETPCNQFLDGTK